MALILSLETSAEVCSVAIHLNGNLTGLNEIHIRQSHASRLIPAIEDLFHLVNVGKEDLEGVAVSAGPGSYTGLRIGVSVAKGLCYGLDIPLIGLNTLEIMAVGRTQDLNDDCWLSPMIDARRDEVYTALYNKDLALMRPPAPWVVTEQGLRDLIGERRVLFFGSGAAKCHSLIEAAGGVFIEGIYPAASPMGLLAEREFRSSNFADLASFEPIYLKAFQGRKQR